MDRAEAEAALAEYGVSPDDVVVSFTCGSCGDKMAVSGAVDHIRLFHPEKWSD